jgi:hypothetical protein
VRDLSRDGIIGKPPQPNEAVRIADVSELTDDPHPCGFLGLHELPIEKLDESVPRSGIERVLPQIDDRAARLSELCERIDPVAVTARHIDPLLLGAGRYRAHTQ